jgi:hypothetical protein
VTGVLEHRIAESAQLVTLSIDPRHLSLEAEAFMQLPYDASVDLTRAGFDLVHRLGMDELRELAQSDAAPLDYRSLDALAWNACRPLTSSMSGISLSPSPFVNPTGQFAWTFLAAKRRQ